MENKQTAIEWLVEELGEYFPNEIGGINLMVAKAKEMEKEQIRQAYYRGVRDEWKGAGMDFEDFYNENYGTPRQNIRTRN